MRRLALLCLPAAALLAWRGQAAAVEGVTLEQWGVYGFGNRPSADYDGMRTEVWAPFGKSGIYRISARMKSFHEHSGLPGRAFEYSAALSRELYHATIIGRLGTRPPDMQREEYHLAQGEAILTFYGLTLGPLHPELAPVVWESSGAVPAQETFDRTWVTTFHGVYTNTDHHVEQPKTLLVEVENSWQFELRETWRERTSVGAEMGFDRYGKVLGNKVQTVFLDNIQYKGNAFAISGWPNNHGSLDAWQRLGDSWKLWAAGTRLNLLNNQLNFLYGGGLDWTPDKHWRLASGYYYNRRRGTSVRKGISLDLSYAF